jgi:hypothetical protein
MQNFILPYEPQYVGHREAEQKRQETQTWLRNRELLRWSLSVVPDQPSEGERVALNDKARCER